jgi:hypothetical protein
VTLQNTCTNKLIHTRTHTHTHTSRRAGGDAQEHVHKHTDTHTHTPHAELAVTLKDACTAETCAQMKATDEWMYLCAAHKQPQECCAIDYIVHTLDGTAGLSRVGSRTRPHTHAHTHAHVHTRQHCRSAPC